MTSRSGTLRACRPAILMGLITLWLVQQVSCVQVFDVFRMVQYEQRSTGTDGQPHDVQFGSLRSALDLSVTSARASGSLARRAVALQLGDFTLSLLDDLLARECAALLVLLPRDDELVASGEGFIAQWQQIEQQLLLATVRIPFYFAFDDNSTHMLLSDQSPDDSSYQIVVSTAEATPMLSPQLVNLQGWLAGSEARRVGSSKAEQPVHPDTAATGSDAELPPASERQITIALVAHYDAAAIAPGLAIGATASASSVVALLEIARLFSMLYAEPESAPQYNVLFLLTGGAHLNLAGTKQWLHDAQPALLETLDFVLCLDALGGNTEQLTLHVSKPPADPRVKRIYEAFGSTAQQYGVPLQVLQRKIPLKPSADARNSEWEHVPFARRRLHAATLSQSTDKPELSRPHLLDRGVLVNGTVLLRNIRFVSESLAKLLYKDAAIKNVRVFEGAQQVNEHFVFSWLHTLTHLARAAPFLSSHHPVFDALKNVLSQYTSEAAQSSFTLSNQLVFFGPERLQMSAHTVKPLSVDLFIFAVVASYLFMLACALTGSLEGALVLLHISDPARQKKR